jgi:hypothetical protein
MSTILTYLARHGWRETIRILFHDKTRIKKASQKERHKYVYVRRQTRDGDRNPPVAYQMTHHAEQDSKTRKIYRRVNARRDNTVKGCDEMSTIRKSVAHTSSQTRRRLQKTSGRRRRKDSAIPKAVGRWQLQRIHIYFHIDNGTYASSLLIIIIEARSGRPRCN